MAEQPRAATLGADQRGAMMIMGIPMALMLVGMVFYSVGIGETVLHRERIQDAADAGAFSASIMMARGMNILVLINMVMAAVLAVLVALRMVEMLSYAGMAIAGAIGWFVPPALSAIPFMQQSANFARTTYNQLRQPVHQILSALYAAGQGVRYAMPVAAQVRVVTTVTQSYRPEARFAFAIPYQLPLPTKDGRFDDLCKEAGRYAGGMAAAPLRPLPGAIEDVIAKGMAGLAESLSGWFCGEGGASPPTLQIDMSSLEGDMKVGLPQLDLERQCQEQSRDRSATASVDTSVCDEAERAVQAAKPDETTGGCKDNPEGVTLRDENGEALGGTSAGVKDCDKYEERVRGAREWCNPSLHTDLDRDDWEWQVREVTLRAQLVCEMEGDPAVEVCRVQHLPTTYGDYRYQATGSRVLCGRGGTLSTAWSSDDRQGVPLEDLTPVCSQEEHPELPPDGEPPPEDMNYWEVAFFDREGFDITNDDILEIPYTEVSQVLGCSQKKTPEQVQQEFDIPDGGEPLGGEGGSGTTSCGGASKKVHQEVSQTTLGEEEYQMRVVAVGTPPSDRARELIQNLAADGQSAGTVSNTYRQLTRLAQLYVAQSEFYFDHDHTDEDYRDPKRWMWSMYWRARLKRFRLPEGNDDNEGGGSRDTAPGCAEEPPASMDEACNDADGSDGSSCGGGLQGKLRELQNFIIH